MTTTSLLISTVLVACAALSSVAVVEGFTTPAASSSSNRIPASSLLASSQGEDENAGVITTAVDSRRDFMSTVASFSVSAAGAAVMSVAGSGVLAPLPANAASGDKINARLKAYVLFVYFCPFLCLFLINYFSSRHALISYVFVFVLVAFFFFLLSFPLLLLLLVFFFLKIIFVKVRLTTHGDENSGWDETFIGSVREREKSLSVIGLYESSLYVGRPITLE